MSRISSRGAVLAAATAVASLVWPTVSPAGSVAPIPHCRSSQLEVAVSFPPGGAAAGTRFVDYLLVNVSHSTCQIRGFASLTFDVNTPDTKTAVTVRHAASAGTPKVVDLAALSDASFAMSYGDAYDQGIADPTRYFSQVGWVQVPGVVPSSGSWYNVPTDFNLAYAGFTIALTPIVAGPTPPSP